MDADNVIYKLTEKKIAILVATYNGEQYLKQQLDSIRNQTYQDFCCFIHDDGSTDSTVKILRRYCSAYPDQFKLLEGPASGGAKYNFMYLMNSIDAAYIMFCDQDDVWLPDKVEKTFNMMKKEDTANESICVYSDMVVVDSDLKKICDSYFAFSGKNPKKNELIELLKINVVAGCTMMINRNLRNWALCLKNIENIYMHDWWIALLASAEGKILFLNQPLSLYRQHSDNVVGAQRARNLFDKSKDFLYLAAFAKKKKEKISVARNFAIELSAIISSENKNYLFLKSLAEISSKGKINRIKFYLQNRMLYKKANIIWQILWI